MLRRLSILTCRRFQNFKMESDRLKSQQTEIKNLTNQLDQLVQKATKAANENIQSNVEKLQNEQNKLHYQVRT